MAWTWYHGTHGNIFRYQGPPRAPIGRGSRKSDSPNNISTIHHADLGCSMTLFGGMRQMQENPGLNGYMTDIWQTYNSCLIARSWSGYLAGNFRLYQSLRSVCWWMRTSLFVILIFRKTLFHSRFGICAVVAWEFSGGYYPQHCLCAGY